MYGSHTYGDITTPRTARFARLFQELGIKDAEARAKEAAAHGCILEEDAISFVFPPEEQAPFDSPLKAAVATTTETKSDHETPMQFGADDVLRLSAYLEPNKKDVREFEIERNCTMQDLREKLADVLQLSPYVTSIIIFQDGFLLATPYSLRDRGKLAVEITDQLQPAETEPVEVTNVGKLEYLDNEAYSHYNQHVRGVLLELAKECPRWRRIRGDGNCFYRAYVVGVFDQAFGLPAAEQSAFLKKIEARLSASLFMTTRDVSSLQKVFKLLNKNPASSKLLEMMNNDIVDCDALLVWACRCAIAEFIFRNQQTTLDGDIAVEAIIQANFGRSVDDFCRHTVLSMGVEAEDLILPVAPRALGVPLVVCMVHSDEHVQLQKVEYHPNADDRPTAELSTAAVHVLFQPGHYDLLYTTKQSATTLKSVHDYQPAKYASSTALGLPSTDYLLSASTSSAYSNQRTVQPSQLRSKLFILRADEREALHHDLCQVLDCVQSSTSCFEHCKSFEDVYAHYSQLPNTYFSVQGLNGLEPIRSINAIIEKAILSQADEAELEQLQQHLTTCIDDIEQSQPSLRRPLKSHKAPPTRAATPATSEASASITTGSASNAEPSIEDIRQFYQLCDQATQVALLEDLRQLKTEFVSPTILSSKHVDDVFRNTRARSTNWLVVKSSTIVRFVVAQLVKLREEVFNLHRPSLHALTQFVNRLIEEFEFTIGSSSPSALARAGSRRRLEKQDSLIRGPHGSARVLRNDHWQCSPSFAVSVRKDCVEMDLDAATTFELTQTIALQPCTQYFVELKYHDTDVRIKSLKVSLNGDSCSSHSLVTANQGYSVARMASAMESARSVTDNQLRITVQAFGLNTRGCLFTLFEVRLVPSV